MFNPDKLLGGLIRGGVGRRGGMGALVSGGAALGLVGVAMEAVEHYMNRPSSASPAGPPTAGSLTGGAPPPPPAGAGRAGVPPPVPPGTPGAGPPPPPESSVGSDSHEPDTQHSEAVLLIRAMIAAANADGVIDAQERANILDRLKSADLSREEHEFMVHELLSPQDPETIVAAVSTRELARQIYMVSLMAIEVDTEAEQVYLENLARRLALTAEEVADIKTRLESMIG